MENKTIYTICFGGEAYILNKEDIIKIGKMDVSISSIGKSTTALTIFKGSLEELEEKIDHYDEINARTDMD
jgi:hypothetical protein